MRIALTIHHTLDLNSGAPGTTMLLARALADRGHDVALLSLDDLPGADERLRALLFPVLVDRRLRRLGRRIDVVDASTGDAWVSVLRRGLPQPLITRSHGLEHIVHDALMREVRTGRMAVSRRYPVYHGGIRLFQVALSLRRADAALFLNRGERDYAVEYLGVDRQRAFVVPLGLAVPADGELSGAAARGGTAHGIAQIGTYQWRKGSVYAREALTLVLRKRESAHALLLGTGVAAEEVLADYAEDVRPRIAVVPAYRRDELSMLLAGCGIALFPSLAEGFPLGLVESMAHGLAPVASAIPGSNDIVRDGIDGILVPPADSTALAGAVERLLDDDALGNRLRAAARARAQEFTWSRTVDATEALYEQVRNGAL